MSANSRDVRVIRVFVSSPSDVARERAVLDKVIGSINRTEGRARGLRLELFRWEKDVTPETGPSPQSVVDAQTPPYDVYLGIMSARFGTSTGEYGSGTEKEFREALASWEKVGSPRIAFYFNDAPKVLRKPDEIEQYRWVCEFRDELESKGIVCAYKGVRRSDQGFSEKVSEHLRGIVVELSRAELKRRKEERAKATQSGTGPSASSTTKGGACPRTATTSLTASWTECCSIAFLKTRR